ncbi:MAG: hypothetical protein M3N52_06685 [Actinomycetota bacterium]|nr:hypothetical protein [Actinomycetota bacterium]
MPARTQIMGFKAAAVAFVAAALTACGGAQQDVGAPTTASRPPVADLYDPWVPDDPDPARRSGAAGRFVECVGPIHLGGAAPAFGGPSVGGTTPREGLQRFLDERLFGLPRDGYEVGAAQGPRVLFTYRVEGATKVAAIVARAGPETDTEAQAGWAIETFATCDPSEYAASADREIATQVWTDREGNRLPTSTIASFRGHEHCDWQSVTFLLLGDGQSDTFRHLSQGGGDRQYVRDPQGVLERDPRLVQPFDGNATLPGDAIDTGYRRAGRALWLSADGRVAYVVGPDGTEAWPGTRELVACM